MNTQNKASENFVLPDDVLKEEEMNKILKPVEILENFKMTGEPFHFYKFLVDHLLDLIGQNKFESYSHAGAMEFADDYGTVLNLLFEAEQHSIDQKIKWSILDYQKYVKGEICINDESHILSAMVEKYGSVSRGLDILKDAAGKRKAESHY